MRRGAVLSAVAALSLLAVGARGDEPPKTETFASSDGRVSVAAPEGAWEKFVPATVEFETGTLLLLGRYQKEKDNQNELKAPEKPKADKPKPEKK